MNANIHGDINNLVAAYEQGLLSPEEEARFEEHLYECEECFREAASFSQAVSLFRRSSAVREEIGRLAASPEQAGEENTASSSSISFLKYLLAAAIILVVAIPSYMFLLHDEPSVPDQKIMLLPVRGSGQSVVDLSKGGTVEISFASDELAGSGPMTVRIFSDDGQILFERTDFDDFSDVGTGVILIDAEKLRRGQCRLEVSPSDSAVPLRVFYFTVQ